MPDAAAAHGSARVRLAWAVALLLIAALEFVPSYSGAAAPVALALAAIVPIALVRGLQALRLGVFVPTLLVIVLAVLGAWLALRHAARGGPLGGLGDAIPRLLTTPRPAPGTAALLAPVVLVVALVGVLVAAAVCAPVVASARTSARGLLAPVLGAAVLYVAAQLLAAGRADRYGIVAVCLLAVAAFGWTAGIGRGPVRSPAAALPVVVVALVAVGVAALPATTPFDARRHVTPPTVRLHQDSPLSQLAAWSVNPSVPVLRARVQGTTRLHLATLTRFTGDSWQVDDRYRALGVAGDSDLPAGSRQAPVQAVVQVQRLSVAWLPAPGHVRAASLDGLLVDPDTATVARAEPARPGLTYTVRGTVDAPTGPQLAAAAVPADTPPAYLALPDAPAGFGQYARQAVRGASTPLEEAIALEHAVSTNRRLDPQAPSGSSYGRLQTFLFTPSGTAGAQAGSEEQFAAAFAVLAREVGLPSRLTVGFLLDPASKSRTVTVHGRDASVWPEVYFAGAGWVPFEPVPGSTAGGSGDAKLRQSVLSRLATKAQDAPPVIAPPAGGTRPTSQRPAAAQVAPEPDRTWWWVGGALVLVALAVAALLWARALRRRRHRLQGARGAWAEFEDLLVLLGRVPAASASAPELARSFDDAHPGTRVRAGALAVAADRAAWAPVAPVAPAPASTSALPETSPAGGSPWAQLQAIRRGGVRALPWYRRWLLPLDPRPLLRRPAR